MVDVTEISEEIASVQVRAGGEIHKLVLTKNYVSMNNKKWIFREDTSYIPLVSIDSIFFGWKRYWIILAIGIICLIGGLPPRYHLALVISLVFFLWFWFYKSHLLLVRSSKETLGGDPVSADEARKFIEALTTRLNSKT